MTTRKRSQGQHPHIVISTKDLQEPQILEEFFQTSKSCQSYVISVEYGTNGHAHLESFSSWDKEVRQDKLKEKILKLYQIEDYHGKLNTKITFNHIDPDPMYGYGYSIKEQPMVMLTNLDSAYLEKCLKYYQDHNETVKLAQKESLKESSKVGVNQIIDDFILWLYKRNVYHLCYKFDGERTYVNNFRDQFKLFYQYYPKRISYTDYSKIKMESVQEYINMELDKMGAHSLDCAPPHKP